MRRPKTIINCRTCGSELQTYPYLLKRGLGVTCSRKCGAKINRGVIKRGQRLSPTTEFKKGQVSWNKGKSWDEETLQKIKDSRTKAAKYGEKNHEWRGDDVSYSGLHYWVERQMGKPSYCEHCDKTTGMFHWANKSHKYKRDTNDWLRLCVSCHQKYDKVAESRVRDYQGRFI